MTAQLADKLRPFGIDYVDAMDRFGDNAELYERLALKYLDDGHLVALQAAMEAKDYSEGYSQAHALKGVAGNLSFKDPLRVRGARLRRAVRRRVRGRRQAPPRSGTRPRARHRRFGRLARRARCRRGAISLQTKAPGRLKSPGLFRLGARSYSSTRSNISRGAPQMGHM